LEPLPVIVGGLGLVVGGVLAWLVRGRQLDRQRRAHVARSRDFEENLATRQVRIETLEADRDAVQAELERTGAAMDEVEQAWSRDREVSAESLKTVDERIGRLTAELGQLREQLGQAHRDIDLQKQASASLEEQLTDARQQLEIAGEKLEAVQGQLVVEQRQRKQLVEQLGETGRSVENDGKPGRRWRINTFFES
jgi:chromosome segregation ATPase